MSSPVIQTAPLEVGRSSSQSALSERPGRFGMAQDRSPSGGTLEEESNQVPGGVPPTSG